MASEFREASHLHLLWEMEASPDLGPDTQWEERREGGSSQRSVSRSNGSGAGEGTQVPKGTG